MSPSTDAAFRRALRGTILSGALVAVVVVAALQLAAPTYDSRRQLVSELADVPHGELLLVAFAALSCSLFATALAMKRGGGPWPLGLAVLVAAAAFGVAGALPMSRSAEMHVGCVAVGFVSIALVMGLGPFFFGPLSGRARVASWSACVAMVGAVALSAVIPFAIAQRLAGAVLVLWIVWAGWRSTSPAARELAS